MNKKYLISIISDNNLEFIKKAILDIQMVDDADLLIIDDGSDYDLIEEISDYKFAKCILHDQPLGYGVCIDGAFTFARDMEYKYLITLSTSTAGFSKDIPLIIDNLKYGYDIVTCSRILENYNHGEIDASVVELYEVLSEQVNKITELTLTDPLSGNKGYNIESMKDFELTDSGHGVLLQLFIQGAYFGYTVIEIPSDAGLIFGEELYEYENPLEHFISVIETEKYLYSKGTIN